MEQYERLQDIGSFGLSVSIKFDMFKAKLGDGYRKSALISSSLGTRSWKLVYKTLPGTMDNPIQVTDVLLQSRADYIWDLFCRCKAGGDLPIIIVCPRNGKDYCAVFEEDELTYEMFSTKLFSSGLSLGQYRTKGLKTLEDGSLGVSDNPDRI